MVVRRALTRRAPFVLRVDVVPHAEVAFLALLRVVFVRLFVARAVRLEIDVMFDFRLLVAVDLAFAFVLLFAVVFVVVVEVAF